MVCDATARGDDGVRHHRQVGERPAAQQLVENSHLPLRRREQAMLRFRRRTTLQKFAAVRADVHTPFDHERHLVDRRTYKERRSPTWRSRRTQC